MSIGARQIVRCDPGLDGFCPFVEPVPDPFQPGRFIEPAFLLQKIPHAWDDQGLNIGDGDLCQCPNPGLACCVSRQQRRLGPDLIDVFRNGQRLAQAQALVFEQGQDVLRIEALVGLLELFALAQIDKDFFVGNTLEIQGDADAKSRQRAPLAVEDDSHRKRCKGSRRGVRPACPH